MELSIQDDDPIEVGADITCLLGDARLKNAVHLNVVSGVPLILEGVASEIKKYEFPRSVILVLKVGSTVLRGEGEAISVEEIADGKALIYFSNTTWEEVDRRQYPRITVSLPIKLRAVYESKEETIVSVVEGRTVDLSVGGSKVRVEHPVRSGSLVEFAANLNALDSIRALGVVVYSDEDGFLGISFMDYLGATRSKLNEFTKTKAA